MAEKLIGPKPIIGPGDSPNVIGGQGQTTEYAPMDEAARRAIFGLNPATGKAYTDAESAAANGGYNPYAGAIGYEIDPRTGNLNILTSQGTVLTTGARYQTSPAGYIVPQAGSLPPGVASDEYGKYYEPGDRMPGESIASWVKRLSALGPGVIFDKGKAIQYDASGQFYIEGEQNQPPGFGSTVTPTGVSTSQNLGSFVRGAGMAASGQIQNPYLPGTEAFTGFQQRESAYNLLRQQMAAYGLESLVDPLKNLVLEGVSPSEFTIRLRDTSAYKQRFGANQARINKGLRALSEAEYIGLEDQYQDVMRRYGMPATYYTRGDLGRQEGFEKFIAGDVSPVELEDRVQTAYNRVLNANPEVSIALRNFYPGITNGDILAYSLDPDRALDDIKRKITAAEIGGAAVQAGLTTNESDAAYLARYGITKEQAQQGYRTISGALPRAQQLSSIYGEQVAGGPYTQASAEREIFGVPGAAEEERKRRRITSLEQAAFSGQAGLTRGALDRERAGQY
jgi:hypothetical protein